MLGILAAILFAIGFLVHAADLDTAEVFSPTGFLLLGLISLSLFLSGVGPTLHGPRRRSRS